MEANNEASATPYVEGHVEVVPMPRMDRDTFDARVIVVRPGHPGPASHWSDDQAGFEQWVEGPTYVVVGHSAPEDRCRTMAARFNLSPERLIAFRDAGKVAP